MNTTRPVAIATLGLLLAAPALADEGASLDAWDSITGADLARHISVLASDEFEGRAPGTPGEEKTIRYLEDAFLRAGAAPGFRGSFLQPVPLVELTRIATPSFGVHGADSRAFAFEDEFKTFAGRPAKAIDNATGTAGLIELAEAFAALPEPPRRTVCLVATTAEEKGLLGSEYLAAHPLVPLTKTAAVINLDALFPFGPFPAMTVTALGSSEIETVLAESAARLDRILQDDSSPEAGAYYRSDHYPFARRGVPALFAVGNPRMGDLVEGSPMLARFMDYLSNGYHKPADEYDPETWDLAGVEGDVRIFFETGWRIAEDRRMPNWFYGNEFRETRDRMMRPRP